MFKYSLVLLFFCLTLLTNSWAQPLQTVFEKSGGRQTATYEEAISYFQQLEQQANGQVSIQTYGATDVGKPLHLVIYAQDKTFDPEQIRKNKKAVLLINNAIHPGEPDGVDASMLLLRNILRDKKLQAQLKNTVLLIIPFYNVDGALNRNSHSRANQNGPESYGFRGNARHLDLNRDFIKTDSRNSRTFQEIFHKWQPDVFVEPHVSNGADYQYVMTYIETQPDKLGGELGQYISNRLTPQLEAQMKQRKFEMTPYVNHWEAGPIKDIVQFMETPRYSSGYAALFGTLGYITETHMLKPYKARVEATYQFLLSMLEVINKDREQILRLRDNFKNQVQKQEVFTLEWKNDRSKHRPLQFKGYESQFVSSAITGLQRLKYDRSKPRTWEVPFYNYFVPKTEVKKPAAYIIPQAWDKVIALLQLNGLQLEQLDTDTTMEVQAYYISAYQTVSNPYEGHYLHFNTQVRKEPQKILFHKGDYLLVMNQEHNRYAMETLEPQATDSYFNWNFFDSVLQQKEHFSDYVFEDIALKLLQEDPALKQKLEEKKQQDSAFAQNHQAQLDFIYKHSPYYEKAHNRYPVYRLENNF